MKHILVSTAFLALAGVAHADPVFLYSDADHPRVALPACAGDAVRDVVVIRKADGYLERAIEAAGSDTINGEHDRSLYAHGAVSLHCDKSGGWWVY